MKNIEMAKPVNTFKTQDNQSGAVYKGANNSHFTRVGSNYHETTEVGGLKQGRPIKVRNPINLR